MVARTARIAAAMVLSVDKINYLASNVRRYQMMPGESLNPMQRSREHCCFLSKIRPFDLTICRPQWAGILPLNLR